MASSSNSISVISLLLLIITSKSALGHSLTIIDSIPITGILIEGVVFCSASGNAPTTGTSIPAVGVPVTGSCNGGSGNVFKATTNRTGFASGSLAFVDDTLFRNNSSCTLTIQLPVTGTNCTLFPPAGILQAAVTFSGTVITVLDGAIAVFVAGLFGLL